MRKIIVLLLVAIGLAGCVAPKSYVDPKYRGVTYQEIKAPAAPEPVNLVVIGQVNGKTNGRASEFWKRQVERVLNASRVFAPGSGQGGGTLTITINNFGDVKEALGKGFVTGFTFGAVGSTVTDFYTMTVDYKDAAGKTFEHTYRHEIHTTLGNAEGPQGVQPMTPAEAPSVVAEDMVLHFLKDLQASGKQ